jgi:hypothetical protein
MSHLDARDCAADALFNAFKICLDNKNISLNNLLCVASDEASVMVGKYNSFFFSKILAEVPHATLLKCIL